MFVFDRVVSYTIALWKCITLTLVFRYELLNMHQLEEYFAKEANRTAFQERVLTLGVVGIKISQWISQRIDLVGPNTILALESFQKSVPSHSLTDTIAEIEWDTNAHWDETFLSIDKQVLGSGSISQVHSCVTLDGETRAVKVMHPNAKTEILTNIGWFQSLIPLVQFWYPPISIFNLTEFLDTISVQVDYESEALNQMKIREVVSTLDFIIVPEIYQGGSGFIVQDKARGLTRQQIRDLYPEYLVDMAEKTQAVYFWMCYCGYVHTDLHDGNTLYVIDEDDDANNKLVLLDFGLVFDLPDKKEDSFHIKFFDSCANKSNSAFQKVITQSINTDFYSPTELSKIQQILQNTDFMEDLDKMDELNVVSLVNKTLEKINRSGVVMKTGDLYTFVGSILVCKDFIDHDEEPFDVSFAAMKLLETCSDPDVHEYSLKMIDYMMKISDLDRLYHPSPSPP